MAAAGRLAAFERWFPGLWASGTPLADVRHCLRDAGRLDTLRHVSRVAAQGRRLARRFGLPLASSDLACCAHDLAAVVPARDVVEAAEALEVPLTPADRAVPAVIHGRLGAAALRTVLGVADPDVLNAVAYHTTLRPGASGLEALVFVADKLAYDPTTPNTGFHPPLLAARDSAPLQTLCWLYLDWAVCEGPALGWRLHRDLLAAHAELRNLLL
jgi:predicted HD superfamily hydrolase involved in NAD metabolism